MLYTLKIRLYPSSKQTNQFLKTMERFNDACNLISKFAFENKIFSKAIFQRFYYYQIRKEFKLSSKMVIRAIAKVCESYSDKNKRENQHKFKPHGAIVYDDRILTVKSIDTVSVISKKLVQVAKGTKRAIVLEDLKGIRQRAKNGTRKTVCKTMRQALSSWSFYQLRQFIEYKAKAAGILVIYVNPHNTSRTCSKCGHVDKKNRRDQEPFVCSACGHALNIARRGAEVIQPNVAKSA